jgi:hypothetical protein
MKKPFKRNSDYVPASQIRYNGIRSRMRGLKRLPKNIETEISYTINEIESYGFDFFPNHYLWELLDKVESLLDRAINQKNGVTA